MRILPYLLPTVYYHMPISPCITVYIIFVSGGFAEVVSYIDGHYTATFTFPDISADILNNTQLRCADIVGDDNSEMFYMAGIL